MKETKKRRYIVSTIMYGMILIFIQLPWVVLKGKNYSIYAAYFRIKAKGIKALSEMAASVWDGNLTIIRIQLILLIVFQIVIVLHIVTQWLHKEYYLNIAALVVLGLYIVVNESGFGMLADNSTKTILIPAIIMIFVMAEVLIRKMPRNQQKYLRKRNGKKKKKSAGDYIFREIIPNFFIRWSGTILNMTGKITASCCSVV